VKRLRLLLLLCMVVACRGKERAAVLEVPRATPVATAVPEPVLGYIDETRSGTPTDGVCCGAV
jgi:hypothetical protein